MLIVRFCNKGTTNASCCQPLVSCQKTIIRTSVMTMKTEFYTAIQIQGVVLHWDNVLTKGSFHYTGMGKNGMEQALPKNGKTSRSKMESESMS